MGADVKSLVDMVAPVLAKPTSDNDAFVIHFQGHAEIAGLMVEIEYPLAGAVGQAYATAYLDVVLTGHGNGRMVITGQAIGLDDTLYLVYVVRVGGIAATLAANNPIVIVIGRKLAEITVLLVTLYDSLVVGYAFFH